MSDALWVLVWGLFYFRGIETGNDYFRYYQERQRIGDDEARTIDEMLRMPAVHLTDVRVVAQSVLLAAPGFLNSFIRDDAKYLFFVSVSMGAFLNALTPYSSPEPEPVDIGHPILMVMKWLLGKIDQFVKIAFVGGALVLLTLIPWIGPVLKTWSGFAFGIIPGRSQTSFFTDLVGLPFYGVLPMMFASMIILRFTLIATTQKSVKVMFLISVACVFTGYQSMLDSAFQAIPRDLPSLPLTLTAMLMIDFTVMVVGLFIKRAAAT